MLFSVLIPVYNVEQYLAECLNSVINQSFKDFEVVLVDDGSTDLSAKICDEYCEKYSNLRVIHKENEGLISARRKAIQAACGQYFIFCDSDDMLELFALEKLAKIILKYNTDLIIFKSYAFIGKVKKEFTGNFVLNEGIVENKTILYEKFLNTGTLNSLCCKCVNRNIVDVTKDYTSMYQNNYGEDFLQTAPILLNAKVVYCCNDYLYNYRHDSGMMRKYNPDMYSSYVAVYSEVAKYKKYFNIPDFEVKIAAKIVGAKIVQVQSLKYLEDLDKEYLQKIIDDLEYRKNYEKVRQKKGKHCLPLKRRVFASFIYYKFCTFFLLLIKFRRMQYLNMIR